MAALRRPWRGRFLHLLRIALLLSIVWLIRDQHTAWQHVQAVTSTSPITLDVVRPFFPEARALSDAQTARGMVTVYDSAQRTLGLVVQTSPQSDSIVGYSGSTNVLIAFDADERVLGIHVLDSGDTDEHVADVVDDRAFMNALVGRDWRTAAETHGVDAVSGASLTSLAILEGISARLSGSRPSLRFPDEITVPELVPFFPNAGALTARAGRPAILDVVDAHGERLGACFRTSPAADEEIGYQGPTDTLVVLGADERVIGIRLRDSFDNEPYVGYVRDEAYFLECFDGRTIDELARLDPAEAGIEGVSGATMTSLAVAHGIATGAQASQVPHVERAARFVWSARDTGTAVVILAGLLICFTRLRSRPAVRRGFQLVLVGYFGFMNGDLLSQALFVGWAQSGVPWRLAPGLATLVAVAFVIPPLTKRQVYCHHLCPYGAAQQLVRIGAVRHRRLPARLIRGLKLIPALLLVVVVGTAMRHGSLNLAALEPFDAFVFWIAGAASLSIAAAGLVAARFVPLAYCRFGCPTGAVLDYARRHARTDRLTARDAIAILLLIVAAALRYL